MHMLIHTDLKPFKCGECSYATFRSNDLKTHMRTHTGEKPYRCSACSFAASYHQTLKKHMLTTHPDTTPPSAASRANIAEQDAADDDVSVLTDDVSEGEDAYKYASHVTARPSGMKKRKTMTDAV
jgi:hypothetical protein